ncbi:unnamed protein product [Caenorhabditis angaria]|uniref:Decapping nuclease n=1 Tax=Caenorhabditis angaria TaxID=860376 RepID=A0A9P1MVF9_9PELO|nr:unnamed protein product [Caenorhabditis angaria]CAI5440273.1 unnamed protein product [Caenorhabditis angaria]CAI5440274.1 unnamed protein product [Caenorhabditis angaria]
MSTIELKIDKQFLTAQKFPYFSKPQIIGEYFVNKDRSIQIGRMAAKNLNDTPLRNPRGTSAPNFDLDAGYSAFDPKDPGERLEILQKWCEKMAPAGGRLRKLLHGAEFFTWRGLLTKIGAAVYAGSGDTWRFRAFRIHGVVFMCEEETEDKTRKMEAQTDREKHMTYWGHKFEQYMTLDDGMDLPDTTQPVSTREEFATVIRTTLESSQPNRRQPLELFYSAEIDCLDRDGKYVELKTNKGDLRGWFWTAGAKSLKWWLQSFLVAIDYLVVGHRDDRGIVTRVSSIQTAQLQKQSQWYGGAAIRLISQVLTQLSDFLPNENQACVVEFGGGTGENTIRFSRCSEDLCDFVPEEFRTKFW